MAPYAIPSIRQLVIHCESGMCDDVVTILEKESMLPLSVQRGSIRTSGLRFMVRSVSLCDSLVIDFYNDVIMLFSVIQYECTSYSCPSMTAGKYHSCKAVTI